MTENSERFPLEYERYLLALDEDAAAAVLPVLKQSVADGSHGVLVTRLASDTQAEVSPEVPFGEVRENER